MRGGKTVDGGKEARVAVDEGSSSKHGQLRLEKVTGLKLGKSKGLMQLLWRGLRFALFCFVVVCCYPLRHHQVAMTALSTTKLGLTA